jgi:hypothetical protein
MINRFRNLRFDGCDFAVIKWYFPRSLPWHTFNTALIRPLSRPVFHRHKLCRLFNMHIFRLFPANHDIMPFVNDFFRLWSCLPMFVVATKLAMIPPPSKRFTIGSRPNYRLLLFFWICWHIIIFLCLKLRISDLVDLICPIFFSFCDFLWWLKRLLCGLIFLKVISFVITNSTSFPMKGARKRK